VPKAKHKKPPAPPPPSLASGATLTSKFAVAVSVGALIISLFSGWAAWYANGPFLFPSVKLLDSGENGRPLRLNVVIQNNGKTPARRFNALGVFTITDSALPFNPDYSHAVTKPMVSEIAPGGDTYTIEPFPRFNAKDLTDIKSGAKTLWIYGKATFIDGLHMSHEMRWCFKAFQGSKDYSDFLFLTCDSYNGSK
jgi:hypothetical protein